MQMKHNRGALGEALTRFFGIKGQVDAQTFDPHIQSQLVVADLSDSPYISGFARPGMRTVTQENVAASFSYHGVRGAPDVAAQVVGFDISGELDGSSPAFSVDMMLGSQTGWDLLDASSAFISLLPTIFDSALMLPIKTAVGVDTTNVGGTLLKTFHVPAGGEVVFRFPVPFFIVPNVDTGPAATVLMLKTVAVNQALTVTTYGRVWPLGG